MKAYKSEWLVVSADDIRYQHALVVDQGKVAKTVPWDQLDPSIDIQENVAHLLFPGFINAHMHQYGLLSHGIPVHVEIKDFEDFLKKFWWPFVEDRIGLKEIKATTIASAAELIESGVVAYCDTLEAPLCEEGSLIEQAKLVEEIGMRAILSLESCERMSLGNGKRCLQENIDLLQWCRENSSLVEGLICTHTSFTCSADFLKEAKALAEKHDSAWQFHLSESRYEPDYTQKHFGQRAVNYLDSLGVLSDRVMASQCVKVDSEEIKILHKNGVGAIHMPQSNCEVGGGFAPVLEMLDQGIPVALGSDGYDNNFLNVMKMAFLIHKSVHEDPSALPAKEVFRMATEYGAKVLSWEDAGSLEDGKNADFVCMDNGFLTPIMEENLFDQLVVYSKKEYISHVYQSGKALMADKKLTTIDADEAKSELGKVTKEFWREL